MSIAAPNITSYCSANPADGSVSPPSISTYVASTGTSFAAPVGAGAALIAARFYAERIAPGCRATTSCQPGAASPALLKAMLIAGARSMRGGHDRAMAAPWKRGYDYVVDDLVGPRIPNGHIYRAVTAGQSHATTEPAVWPTNGSFSDNTVTWTHEATTDMTTTAPNAQQGFGRINLEAVLSTYPAKDYINETSPIVNAQTSWSKTYSVHDPSLPIRVVLVWTDVPGEIDESEEGDSNPLVNDLNLTVDFGVPCSTRRIGNQMTLISGQEVSTPVTCSQGLGLSDLVNNVEIVTFFPPSAGSFKVKVEGATGPLNQTFALVVHNGFDPIDGTPPGAPSNLSALATGTTSATVSWSASAGATAYELRRKANGGLFATIDTPTSTTFNDGGLAPGTAYVYQVRARNGTAPNQFFSQYTVPAVATTIVFSDDPIQTQFTEIRKTHVDELRTAAHALRLSAALSPYAFSDPVLVADETIVKVTHVNELRAAIEAAFVAIGIPAISIANPTLMPGSSNVNAIDIQELRNALK